MAQEAIFLPVTVLAFWTFTVLTVVPLVRFAARAKGHVQVDDFKLGESANVPAHVALSNRNYMNLLELPVLFYAVTLIYFVTGQVDGLAVNLAWAFVGLRLLHSLVHLTVNTVLVRMVIFTTAAFALIALWAVLAQRLFG